MDDVLKNMGEGKTRLEKITGIEEPIEETTSSVDFEYVKDQLNKIYKSGEDTKAKFPGFPIYISVSKDVNTWLTQYLNGEDYGIRLEQLFGCRYSVSPFIDTDDEWIVGLFDYASIL